MQDTGAHFSRHAQLYFYYLLLVVVAVLTFFIFQPYLGTLLVAASVAAAAMPLYEWLRRKMKFAPAWPAGLLSTLLLLLLIAGPVSFFATTAVDEARTVYLAARAGDTSVLGPLVNGIEDFFSRLNPRAEFDMEALVAGAASWIFEHSASIFSGAASASFQLLLALVAIFFVFVKGEAIEKTVLNLSPLDDRYDLDVLEKLRRAVVSVVRGALLIALIQGVLVGIGFLLFGVPNAALWGGVAVFAALLPGVGTALVLAPAILYLFLTGSAGASIGLLIWGALAVGLIDNLLYPVLMSQGVRIHPLILLLAIIGGINFFGLSGFILGPLTVSLLVALLGLYPLITRGKVPA